MEHNQKNRDGWEKQTSKPEIAIPVWHPLLPKVIYLALVSTDEQAGLVSDTRAKGLYWEGKRGPTDFQGAS